MFHIGEYENYLNEQQQNGAMSRKTKDDYIYRLKRLNNELPCGATCEQISKAIQFLAHRSQCKKYLKAIRVYEIGVLKQTGLLLHGSCLTSILQRYKIKEKEIRV